MIEIFLPLRTETLVKYFLEKLESKFFPSHFAAMGHRNNPLKSFFYSDFYIFFNHPN